jgi:hypothetical protein
MEALEKEFTYYTTHQKELVKKYEGKYLVIKNEQVIGAYGTREEAIQETMKDHKLGSFLVQYVQGGEKNISQTFHSRVVFSAN